MNKTLLLGIGSLALLSLLLFVGARYILPQIYTPVSDLVTSEHETLSEPAGSLIATLKPTAPATAAGALWRISGSDGALTKLFDSASYLAPALSPEGTVASVAAYTGATPSMQLFVAPVADATNPTVINPLRPLVSAGRSTWSTDGAYIAYDGVTPLQSADDTSITTSRIILLERASGTQSMVDTGTSPVFEQDGSLIYIKHDGVYRVTRTGMSVSAPARIWYVEHTLSRNARIALSATNKIALTDPDKGELTVRILDAAEKGQRVGEGVVYKGSYYWPVFSPSGNELAVVEFFKKDDGVHKAIQILNMTSSKARTLMSLDGYANDFLSLGAWVR